jgi:DNA modification methylase
MTEDVHNIAEPIAHLAVPIGDLVPYPRNPRRGNLTAIVESLARNAQYRPIVVNQRNQQILAGNHTWQAAHKLGWTHVAVTYVDCDDQQAARIVAVDNRANDIATYDFAELQALLETLPDLTGTGYTEDELNQLLNGQTTVVPPAALTDPDDVPDIPDEPVAKLGDVWLLGPHRVLCGDSTDVAAVEAMLAGDRADCMWTDPPYGFDYIGGAHVLGSAERRANGGKTIKNDGAANLRELLHGALAAASIVLAHADGPLSYEFTTAVIESGWVWLQNLVWVKSSLVLARSDYHYRHEVIMYGSTAGSTGKQQRIQSGGNWYGDNAQTTVFEVDRPSRNGEHPTMKPVELIVRMLGNSCPVNGLVYEPFGGSGSTLIAAHTLNMRAAVVELDPRYVDVICRRWFEHTGIEPVLADRGEST